MQMDQFDSAAFLRDYWQQKPLLIRNPWAHWRNPLEPDELAGLACEAEVESRLVTQPDRGWALEHGPLPADRFAQLGDAPWTLLVQSVDHHVPDVAALIDPFRFIPNWRIDDVMVSYAVDGGGVGPHFDHYDVFLIQGLGRRRWRIGGPCDAHTPLLPHDDLRLLAAFDTVDEWVLEPGDILYVPPGMAHDGVAVGDDCMTYSIGFRAPSRADLLDGWSEDLLDRMDEHDRYGDRALPPQANPGEITDRALAQMQAMIAEALEDQAGFAQWFGRFSTSPKAHAIDWRPDEPIDADQLQSLMADGAVLLRNAASRFAYVDSAPDGVMLFVDGESYHLEGESADLARRLCADGSVAIDASHSLPTASLELVLTLLNTGSLAIDEEQEEAQ